MKYFKNTLLVIFLLLSLSLGITILVWDPQWLSGINGRIHYSWWGGVWHALCLFPHIIRNIFVDTNCISHNGSFIYYLGFISTLVIGFLFNHSGMTSNKKKD